MIKSAHIAFEKSGKCITYLGKGLSMKNENIHH